MPSVIRFVLKPGASWDIDAILADMQIIVPYLNLTSHNYYETSRQSLLIRAEVAKKRGREYSPIFLSNNLIDLKEKEDVTGVCKAFTIEFEKNKHATGTINEKCGLKIIGEFSLKNELVGKLSEYFRQMADKGELELVRWGGWRDKISQFIFFHFTRRGRLNMRAHREDERSC